MAGAGGVGGLLQVNITTPNYEESTVSHQIGINQVNDDDDPNSKSQILNSKFQTFFPIYDTNGNITSYTNENDEIVAEFEYSPFGKITKGSMVNEFNFRFSTKYHDPETNLYDYGYRFYSPEHGRWLQRDPIAELSDPNLYAFCHNNPISEVDVEGMCGIGFLAKLAMAASLWVTSPTIDAGSVVFPTKPVTLSAPQHIGKYKDLCPKQRKIRQRMDVIRDTIQNNLETETVLQGQAAKTEDFQITSSNLDTFGTDLSYATGFAGFLRAGGVAAGKTFAKEGYHAISQRYLCYGGRTLTQQAARVAYIQTGRREFASSFVTGAMGKALPKIRYEDFGAEGAQRTYNEIEGMIGDINTQNQELYQEYATLSKMVKV